MTTGKIIKTFVSDNYVILVTSKSTLMMPIGKKALLEYIKVQGENRFKHYNGYINIQWGIVEISYRAIKNIYEDKESCKIIIETDRSK